MDDGDSHDRTATEIDHHWLQHGHPRLHVDINCRSSIFLCCLPALPSAMSAIYTCLLYLIHLVYAIQLRLNSLKKRFLAPPPQHLAAPRRRLPKHLAIVFAIDPTVPADAAREALTKSVMNAVEWCRIAGIRKLTVYEENGTSTYPLFWRAVGSRPADTLAKCSQALCERLPVQEHEGDSSESDIDYPLTPPPSDHSESRPLSPADTPRYYAPLIKLRISEKVSQKHMEQKKLHKRRVQSQRRHFSGGVQAPARWLTECSIAETPAESVQKSDLLLCMISAEASKPTIAAVASALAERERARVTRTPSAGTATPFKLSVDDLDQLLEGTCPS